MSSMWTNKRKLKKLRSVEYAQKKINVHTRTKGAAMVEKMVGSR